MIMQHQQEVSSAVVSSDYSDENAQTLDTLSKYHITFPVYEACRYISLLSALPIKWTTAMQTVKVISKIKPSNPDTMRSAKENHSITDQGKIIQRLKCIFYMEALFGINRLCAIPCPKLVKLLSLVYTLCIISATVFSLVNTATELNLFSYLTRNGILLEYIVLSITALTFGNKTVKNQIGRVHKFCGLLNLNGGSFFSSCTKNVLLWLGLCACLNALEIFLIYNSFLRDVRNIIYLFIILFGRDFEVIILILQIRNVHCTLLVIKAHVNKILGRRENDTIKLSVIQMESLNVTIDIKSLHDAYTVMDKCSRNFNSYMNIPVTTVLISSAFYTTILLKWLVFYVQTSIVNFTYEVTYIAIYIVIHVMKIVYLVIVPCYYASSNKVQAAAIRKILSNSLENMTLGLEERRKIKAFFYLTRECDFSYALCRLVKLDMAFPPAYLGLCFTYLIIFVQFSKLID